MAQTRKLQIFVSSTFTDLIDERQAAVMAILTAGHIPAGMELFTAGSEEQMKVIYDWIDESDAYMLLIGGRYGSVEPNSGKSYTQLEYEYATKVGKPTFALVLHEKFIDEKVAQQTRQVVLEKKHARELEEFTSIVKRNMVKFPENIDQIKLHTRESISEIERKPGLTGWIRATDANQEVAEQLAQLVKENGQLRERLRNLPDDSNKYGGLSFDQTIELLNQYSTELCFSEQGLELAKTIKFSFNQNCHYISAADYLWLWYLVLPRTGLVASDDNEGGILNQLHELDLVSISPQGFGSKPVYGINKSGLTFCLKIKHSTNMGVLQPIITEFKSTGYDLFRP
ncbi:DUF4062 domain-containing protein [Fibrella sp. WM1]|uniref:DUF4062 domain-containing protein n=1 Tax=Fibrella musci TaxID=3242485 RepID=UPI0035223664